MSKAEEQHPTANVDEAEIEAIAAEAHAHARSVERRLLGLKIRGRVAARVDAAIARRGLRLHCIRVDAASEPPRAA